ncbi:hypothetical protein BDW02DRAFT_186271 [Decorospora gaudefroyi]|uniref:Carrier domain-containing protein n=1 Tax=Decorospora gaudefroyi TaxID=184978 RepID=A0A6A5KFJ3_9PLEO|nr:hypothetical protein BDW02DRAFT_186271 [Decorospora gaudefroyi]
MVQVVRGDRELSILNERPSILSGPRLLHELVRPLHHDATAIDFLEHGSKRRKFSYKKLHILSEFLASEITKVSAKLERASPIIPVFLPQSPELYVVLLAISKAGRAFCPISLETPTERLKFILEDVSADLLITTSSYEERIRAITSIQVLLADRELSYREERLTVGLPQTSTNDLAYVLYTSGSTGLPKAVGVSHRSVTQSLLSHDRHIPDFARFLQFAAPTFDVSIFEIFFPWFRGRTLVGCSRAQLLDDLPGMINNLEVDAAELTPTVVSSLLNGRSSVPGLRLLLTIGEMLTQHVVDEYGGNKNRESMLWAMYGPTEASIHCTLQPRFSTSFPIGTIGYPLDTVSAFIVATSSESLLSTGIEILPAGEVGELAIGGPLVAEGYLYRPDLTSASFVEHAVYGRLYRTGDRARMTENGTLECLGRVVTGQVKLRGQRVELGEIEQAVMRTDGCRAATVMVLQENLVAFCARSSKEISRAEIIKACKRWLPAFMVPSDICFVASMPQLPSGKIDKASLEERYLHRVQSNDTPISVTTRPDDHISGTVSRIIRRHTSQDLGTDSELAVAGVDSLQSIRIASALRQEGIGLSAIDVLSATTIGDLIATCSKYMSTNGFHNETKGVTLPSNHNDHPQLKQWHSDIACVLPCTPLQEALLAETIARPTAYCNWIEVELSISRTYDEIRDALRCLTEGTQILRTGFYTDSQSSGTFSQIIWKEILVSQIREVARFSKAYSIQSQDDLLRPLNIQVQMSFGLPRVLFQIHHALYDGWSFDLLLHDLDKHLRGEEAVKRPQFQDVARYYTAEKRSENHNRAKDYWASLLSDYIPITLPNYNGKLVHDAGVRRFLGRSVINPDTLFNRAREQAVNPQVFFQAATAYILSLYSGSDDVVLGNVTSGRTIPVTGVEDIIGPCIATVPFRMSFQEDLHVRDIIRKVQALNRDSLRHMDRPLRDIARAANIRPGTRLFDILFVWQQSMMSDSDSSLMARVVDSADDLEFKVTLEFEPRQDYIALRATFDSSTITDHQIEYLSRQIDEVVGLFLADTDCHVSQIKQCFTTSSLSIANPTPSRVSVEHGPSYAVEQWAIKEPTRKAVVFGCIVNGIMEVKDVATYGELNSRANRFARLLEKHGVGQDQLVAVLMKKSVDLYVSILAILKLGCGYLPLVPDTPIDRVRAILEDAQVGVCISESKISAGLLQSLSIDVVDFDLAELARYSCENVNTPYNGQHLAYAVFTSGSTGTPKGVLVTQENLMSNLQYLATVYPFSMESRLLQACSQAFDVSVFEIFFSWHVGICLCTARQDDLFRDFEAAINFLQVTHLSLTPTVAALVDPRNVPRVEFLVTAGEALTENVRRRWAGKGLYQGYGPSETTNICTVRALVTPEDLINNIGPPFHNTSALVLDPKSEAILPRGAMGELCFGGYQVFRGYLNRPELNAAKIIDLLGYGRIYRSGDMGILLPDGSILSAGRSDDQVKIRGQRVELGEITSVVLDSEAVQDCVTLLLTRSNNTTTLVNFWVPATTTAETFHRLEPGEFETELIGLFDLLSRRLPTYMVPAHLVPISRLPITAQAKINKSLLQSLFYTLPEDTLLHTMQSKNTHGSPELLSQWEKDVAQILARVLVISPDAPKRTSSFFSLGLDSVSAIRLCNELRTAKLGDFAVSEVLKNPSIAHLVSIKGVLSARQQSVRTSVSDLANMFKPDQVSRILTKYKQRDLRVARILPCTPLQEAMLSSGQSSSSLAYCNVMVFDIKGDVSRLKKCWESMVQRHEILRTSFASTEDPSYAFAQVVLQDHGIVWHQQDLEGNLQSRTSVIISDLLACNKPPVYFALAPVIGSTKLLFCCHHALYDGIAVSTLLSEIQDSYFGCELAPPVYYDVYLQHILDQNQNKANKYWTALFEDFEPSFFPDLTGKISKSHSGLASSSRGLELPLSEILRASRSSSVSLLSIVQATWTKLLHFYTGESDICFGNVVSGRSIPGDDLARLVAPCFNTLPVRVKFDFQRSNSVLMGLTHALNIESLAYQFASLRRIQNMALKESGRLFDTLVILQQPTPALNSSIWTLERDLGDMDLPMVCELVQDQTEDVLRLVLHYDTSLLSEAEALLVTDMFDTCLSSMIRHPEASANDTSGFPARMRAVSNMDFEPFDTDGDFLHSGFERIATLYPDRIALDFLHPDGNRTTWSFKTLNERSNDIAHALIDQGAKPEDIVPIHMLKSPQFYASILGVLKAGAAFAPVHPDLPEARRELMLRELNSKLVLWASDTPLLAVFTATMINVDTIQRSPGINPTIGGLQNSNLAYCLFTSGSTGVPKAVSMEHRAPLQTIESSRAVVPWRTSSRLLQYAAVTFDMCYYDCFLAWTFGFALCAAEQNELLDDLAKTINDLQVDLLDLTPSVAVSVKRSEVPSVKWLYCIGEAMSPGIAKEWVDACVNSYGPTEAAFCTTICPVSEAVSTSVIGRPFPTTSFAVFSSQEESPLPILGIGELHIGGAQLARGYYGKSELTRERFVTKCNQRFYKSGDMVRMLSDGNFEFIGRADDQVKIRGLRVELGEINHVLQNCCPDVASVSTQIFKKDPAAKEQLVVFLVLRQRIEQCDHVELRRKLKLIASSRLPVYMVPQFFLFVEHIPISMAGKIDKNALAKIFHDSASGESLENGIDARAAGHQWTELESQIRKTLAQLSNTPLDKISATTSIYQLGLDSISAVQIAVALRTHGHAVNATDVMKHTTCIDLAEYMSQAATTRQLTTRRFDFNAFEHKYKTHILSDGNIHEDDIVAIRPCTPLQQGMISQFLAKEGSVYMNYLRLQLGSDVNLDKLKGAWTVTMKHHGMLRTGFAQVKDALHPFAMIEYTPKAVNLPWSVAPQDGPFRTADEWLREVQGSALSTLQSPPWQLRIINNGHTYLDMAIFHALFDAYSLQSILTDVAEAYRNQSLQTCGPLDTVISHIIHSSEQCNKRREAIWTGFGKKANPCRFPNLASLRYDPMPPATCTRPSAKSLSDLDNGCREANITLQAAGIASWLSLLAAYTGEASVTCGVVLSGRTFEATESAVFPCINTVPFACTMSNNKSEMLDTIVALNADIQQQQFTPLKNIQRLMGFPNEALFDTIFAYQKLPGASNTSDIWGVVDEKATIEYPVSIELEPKAGHLEYRLTFLPHIIPMEQASLILDQLDHLMESFIFHSKDIAAAPRFPGQLYSITPAKECELPSDTKLLHELVENTAKQYPQRTALEFVCTKNDGSRSVKQWTYSELDAEGNRVARLLADHSAQPGNLVGVCFDKCPEASFAMLGVLKAGCAFVAIDPGAPAARQSFIVKDSQAQFVLSMSTQSAQFAAKIEIPTLNLDEVEWHSLSPSKPLCNVEINPQDRSYCLYTSGTTGTPKGCELTHENAVQALLAFQRLFAGHWGADSRWLQFASFHFDVSVLEQYWSWSVGICVVSALRDLIFEDLAQSIRDLRITHIDLTPSLAQTLHPDDVPGLCKGVFITGGESLKQEILDVWGPKGVIYNGYGPTEATIGCTMYPRVPAKGKPSNIGPQFDNVGSLVLHPGSDTPVLRGGVGELCVSGKLIGRGYLNRPELTAERFPYLERFGERVYRTGDLVRVLHDGTFDFLGRADDQVKLRGQRLEVGEINSVIKQSGEGISDVATLVLKHPKQQKEQLVAFLVCGKNVKARPDVSLGNVNGLTKAKEACHERLPPYMVPTHFIPLTAVPLNVNNKADARKLKELYHGLSTSDLQRLSATSSDENQNCSKQAQDLRHVVSQVLDVSEDAVGQHTSFFELGMDSISVIGVSRAIKQAGFKECTASMVMRCPTVRRLSKALTTKSPVEDDPGSIIAAQQYIHAVQHRYRRTVIQSLSVEPAIIEALAPCTPLQQGMIVRSLESDDGLYFNTFQFRLQPDINEKKLQATWEKIYGSIQILRTVFVSTDEGYVQAVLHEISLNGMIQTATNDQSLHLHLRKLRQDWLELNRTELRHPFQVHMVSTPTQKWMIVHIFHGLYDGNSIGMVFRAVWDGYNGKIRDSFDPAFHSALAHGPLRVGEGAKKFWQNHLSGTTPKQLPRLIEEPSNKSVIVTREMHALTAFNSVRRHLNVTSQAIAQACWFGVLQEHIKGAVSTGLVVSGRSIDLEGADRIIGPMFNTITYHYQLRRGESWASIIKRVHEFNVAAHPYQHTPLRDIMKWCNRTPSQPLFDNLFVYQIGQEDEEWAKNDAWEILDGDTVADYPLAFEVEQKLDDGFKLTLVTQGHIMDENLANDLLDRFESTLQQVLRNPSTTLELSVETTAATEEDTAVLIQAIGDTNSISDFEWTENATKVRKEVANLSGIEPSQINEVTSIFQLGLDSIDAIKLSSRLKKRGVNISVSGIMRGLTITRMVQNIATKDTQAEEFLLRSDFVMHKKKLKSYVEQTALDVSGFQDIFPLTPLQEAMVAEMVASEYSRYYNHDVLKLDLCTDITKLREAWTEVAKASPILRTGFVEVKDPELDDSFAQIVYEEPHEIWSEIDLEDPPEFPQIFKMLRADAIQTSLSTPPFRLTLVKSPGQSYLTLSIAHALYDGWSLGLLHFDVHRAYHDEYASRPDYESTLAEIVAASGSDAMHFWQDYLSNAKLSAFPRRRDISSATSKLVHRLQQDSAVGVTDIQSFAKKSNVSLQTIGQTVFALVSASYTRSLDITFGSVLSGRDDNDRSQLLFPTMNTVAIRSILHGTGLEMLRYVQDNFTSIKQWQHYPLRKALSQAGVDGRLFESFFIYQKSLEEVQDQKEKLYASFEGHSDVEYPVCVEMEVMNHTLVWRCAVKEEVFDEKGAKELLDRMDAVLKHILNGPEAPIIEVTPQGTFVCGLPAFQQDPIRIANEHEDTDEEHVGQRTSTMETARKIREVLAVVSKMPQEEITGDMTIFHMGLDSISAIKVSSLLGKQGIVLSVGEMLQAGTVERMAKVVDARAAPSADDRDDDYSIIQEALKSLDRADILKRAGIDEDSVAEVLPVTAGQLYMLSMSLNTKGTNFYPEFTYKIHGDVTFGVLQKSWKALITANPILRTVFVPTSVDRIPYLQAVLKDVEGSFTDTTTRTELGLHDFLQNLRVQQPWTHVFVSNAAGAWTLKLNIHHALYDGVSLPLLMHQFQELCNGLAGPPPGENSLLKFIASGYTTSALTQRNSFWAKYLHGITQHGLSQPPTANTAKTEIFRPALLQTSTLEATARRHGVSTQAFFLAAYARLYATMTHTESTKDVVIGIYLANRSLPIEGLASSPIPTVNLLPLRIASPLKHTIVDAATQIQSDLSTIGDTVNASASLYEIESWTGVRIDTFVNFLSLPDTDTKRGSVVNTENIRIVPMEQWEHPVSRVSEMKRDSWHLPSELVHERVNEVYLNAIDVEATIRDGALEVGVFASTEMLGLRDGERLVEDIRKEIMGVL